MNNRKLLPCPFCGQTPELIGETVEAHYYTQVRCGNSRCKLTVLTAWEGICEDAIRRWNTRAKASGPETEPESEHIPRNQLPGSFRPSQE